MQKYVTIFLLPTCVMHIFWFLFRPFVVVIVLVTELVWQWPWIGNCIWKSASPLDHYSWTSCCATLPETWKAYCKYSRISMKYTSQDMFGWRIIILFFQFLKKNFKILFTLNLNSSSLPKSSMPNIPSNSEFMALYRLMLLLCDGLQVKTSLQMLTLQRETDKVSLTSCIDIWIIYFGGN